MSDKSSWANRRSFDLKNSLLSRRVLVSKISGFLVVVEAYHVSPKGHGVFQRGQFSDSAHTSVSRTVNASVVGRGRLTRPAFNLPDGREAVLTPFQSVTR